MLRVVLICSTIGFAFATDDILYDGDISLPKTFNNNHVTINFRAPITLRKLKKAYTTEGAIVTLAGHGTYTVETTDRESFLDYFDPTKGTLSMVAAVMKTTKFGFGTHYRFGKFKFSPAGGGDTIYFALCFKPAKSKNSSGNESKN